MIILDYMRALPHLKGRPKRDPEFPLALKLTAEVTIAQAFLVAWIVRALTLPHNTQALLLIVFLEGIVGSLFIAAWISLARMVAMELRPLVQLRS